MYIEKNLPQFQDQKTLLVVSGRQEALLYLAEGGEIWEEDKIYVEDPGYTDREGFFKSRSKTGGVMKAGSVYKEKISYHLAKEFLNQLQEKVKSIFYSRHPKKIYIFCPDYIKKEMLKKIPKSIRQYTHIVKTGNYIDYHPFDLLRNIQEEEKKKKNKLATPMKEKALKILKRTSGGSEE